tara:strand:- start:416 stop:634 length:219 start_codon:yes stop_codon:yes gene_type:complete
LVARAPPARRGGGLIAILAAKIKSQARRSAHLVGAAMERRDQNTLRVDLHPEPVVIRENGARNQNLEKKDES